LHTIEVETEALRNSVQKISAASSNEIEIPQSGRTVSAIAAKNQELQQQLKESSIEMGAAALLVSDSYVVASKKAMQISAKNKSWLKV